MDHEELEQISSTFESLAPESAAPLDGDQRPGWRWFLLWVGLNVGAGLLLLGLDSASTTFLPVLLGERNLDVLDWWTGASALNAVIAGFVVGSVQWLALKRYLRRLGWWEWTLATVAGGFLVFVFNLGLQMAIFSSVSTFVFTSRRSSLEDSLLPFAVAFGITGAIQGLIVGGAKWMVLRRYVYRAGWWLVVSMLAVGTSQAIYSVIVSNLSTIFHDVSLTIVNFLLDAPFYTIMGGLVLMRLLRSSNLTPADAVARPTLIARLWKPIVIINLALGLLLWFFYLTDYSLPGTFLDIVFPPLMFILSIIAFLGAGYASTRNGKTLLKLSALPSLLGGTLYLIMVSMQFMPHYTMRGMFLLDEIRSETLVGSLSSPDGFYIVDAYLRPGGRAGSTGSGLYLRLRYTNFPLVERDIYGFLSTGTGDSGDPHLSWSDYDTLYIPEIDKDVKLGYIQFETPQVIGLPLALINRWIEMDHEKSSQESLTIAVRDVPVYPGKVSGEQSQSTDDDNLFRSYNVEGDHPDKIADWYKDTFAVYPWSIAKADRYLLSGESARSSSAAHIRHCLQVQREEADGQLRPYFIEVMGDDAPASDVHVNIGSPKPITETCKRFIR